MEQTIQLLTNNFPKQQAIFDDPAKYKIVVKGRRFGLTKGAANDFIKSALEKKYKKGLWVDTISVNIDRYIERYFIPHLKKLPENLWSWKKQDKIITIRDSYIDFRSVDRPENLEGFGYDKGFLNEAGIILKNEYLWSNAIGPMFWDYPDAQLVIGGTPKGKGVFETLYQRGLDPEQTSYKSFHYTSFDSPYKHIHAAINEDISSMPERVVRQEVYAEFLDDTGVVFRGVTEITTATPQPPEAGHLYVIGADLAKVQDFTVITVYDRANNNQVAQDRFNKLEYPFVKRKIYEMSKTYNDALVTIDSTGIGEPIYDDLVRSGIPIEPYRFTNQTKKDLIEKLSVWIEQKRFRMLNIPETIREFNNFTYDISSSGRIMYNAPQGFFDDIVISHGLAVWQLQPIISTVKEKPKTLIEEMYERQVERKTTEEQYEEYEYT